MARTKGDFQAVYAQNDRALRANFIRRGVIIPQGPTPIGSHPIVKPWTGRELFEAGYEIAARSHFPLDMGEPLGYC